MRSERHLFSLGASSCFSELTSTLQSLASVEEQDRFVELSEELYACSNLGSSMPSSGFKSTGEGCLDKGDSKRALTGMGFSTAGFSTSTGEFGIIGICLVGLNSGDSSKQCLLGWGSYKEAYYWAIACCKINV